MSTQAEQQQYTLPNADVIRGLWVGPGSTISTDYPSPSESPNAQLPPQLQLAVHGDDPLQTLLGTDPYTANAYKSKGRQGVAHASHERLRAITASTGQTHMVRAPNKQSMATPSHLQLDQDRVELLAKDHAADMGDPQQIKARQSLRKDNTSLSSRVAAAQGSYTRSALLSTIGRSTTSTYTGDYDTGSGLCSASALEAMRKLAMIAKRAFGSSINPLSSQLLRLDTGLTSGRVLPHGPSPSDQRASLGVCTLDSGLSPHSRGGSVATARRDNDVDRRQRTNTALPKPASRQAETASILEHMLMSSSACHYQRLSKCSLGSAGGSTEGSDITSHGSSQYDAALARLTAECKWRRRCIQHQKAVIYWVRVPLPSHSLRGDLMHCKLATKVFLGGLPCDTSQITLMSVFSRWGVISVQIPSLRQGSARRSPSHAYLVFEDVAHIRGLLSNCVKRDPSSYFYWIPSANSRGGRFAQVIPWATEDNDWVTPYIAAFGDANVAAGSLSPRAKRGNASVFIGGVHGEVSAEGLQSIMAELFGPVLHAGIDTDCHGYPSGSARVTFTNRESLHRALLAGFVQLETARFSKLMQLDPFVDEMGRCGVCEVATSILCRHPACLQYLCATCFEDHRRRDPTNDHVPLMRPRTKP